MENKELMRECLEVADVVWSDLFAGQGIRQASYNDMQDSDDSREVLGYRSAAVTQIAVALFQDARESAKPRNPRALTTERYNELTEIPKKEWPEGNPP